MTFKPFAALAALALSLSAAPALAGPCTQQITEAQAAFDAKLHARAEAGPTATQSTAATMHRQPTPNTVAHAEENLGELSQTHSQAFDEAMSRARAADTSGDAKVCEAAVDEARAKLSE
jgi:hypothetical protein